MAKNIVHERKRKKKKRKEGKETWVLLPIRNRQKPHRQAIIHRACHRKTRHSEGVKFASGGRLPGTEEADASVETKSKPNSRVFFFPLLHRCAVFYCPQKFPYGFNQSHVSETLSLSLSSNRTVCRAKRSNNFKRFYSQSGNRSGLG